MGQGPRTLLAPSKDSAKTDAAFIIRLEATMIGEICSKPAVTAVADTTVQEAAHRMATKRVGALVVIDRDGRPRGVVTDRDITVHVVAAGKHPADVQLGSLLRRRPVAIREDA